MISRREFVQAGLAAAALVGGAGGSLGRLAAQQRLSQADILRFEATGNVTLMHVADIHAQWVPTYFREPSINLGVGDVKGKVPHITGKAFLDQYKIPAGSPMAYALTSEDFGQLAKNYGRMGGLDRMALAIKAIRAELGECTRCKLASGRRGERTAACCSIAVTPGRIPGPRCRRRRRTSSSA